MSKPIVATAENWNDIVGGSAPAFVDFWAPWCSWCRRLAPAFERLASEYAGRVTFAKVNVDEEPELAARYGVQGLPTLKFFCAGHVVGEVVGFLPEANLRRHMDEVLASTPVCVTA